MKLRLSEVPAEGRAYEGEEPPEILGLEGAADVRLLGGIRYSLQAFNVPGALYVKGWIEVDVEQLCSRCGCVFTATVRDREFTTARELTAGEQPVPVADPVVPAAAPLPDGDGGASLDPESVDLTADIRESMILALPSYPVCQPECKGLCPKCGIDLNREACRCRPEADGRWGMLDALHL